MYICRKHLQILKNVRTEVHLAKLKAGVCFGEYSLLDEKEVSASVRSCNTSQTVLLFQF